MKYICLGYYDKSKHDAMTEAEKQAMSIPSAGYVGSAKPEFHGYSPCQSSRYKDGSTKARSLPFSPVPYRALQSDRCLVITT